MNPPKAVAATALVAALAVFGYYWLRSSASESRSALEVIDPRYDPSKGPSLTHVRPKPLPMPKTPPADYEGAARAYAEALADGKQNPGAAAFRVTTDAYVDYNMEFAKQKADEEGITVDEVRELTYFGLLVMRTQQWGAIEDILGTELTDEQKTLGDALTQSANQDFKAQMRELVANGATLEERQAFVKQTEEDYLREYFALTGMTAQQLDQLLGGEFSGKRYAPATTKPNADELPPAEITEPRVRPEPDDPE